MKHVLRKAGSATAVAALGIICAAIALGCGAAAPLTTSTTPTQPTSQTPRQAPAIDLAAPATFQTATFAFG